MKTHLRKIFSGILIALYISSMALSGAVFATPQSVIGQLPDGKHEPKRGVNPETGKVSFIGAGDPVTVAGVSDLKGVTAQERALEMAEVYGREFGLKHPKKELQLAKSGKDGKGNDVVHYQQMYEGIPVMGGEIIVNLNAQGELLSISGEVASDVALDTVPAIKAQEAIKTALQNIAEMYNVDVKDLSSSDPELAIFDESILTASTRPVELVWRMEVTAKDETQPVRELVLVNAQTGEISFHINQVHSEAMAASDPLQTVGSTIQYADLIVDEARSKLYGVDKTNSKIDVIDMSDLAVLESYLLVNGALPTGIDLSPDGNELAVAQSGLSRVKFINLTDGTMSETSSVLTGSNTKVTDVLYGRSGILYALSSNGLHVINTIVFPHAEDVAQFVPDNSSSYSEGFGTLSSDQNTLYYVTGTCCSGYNSLYKFDISAGLAKPVLSKHTYLYGSGSRTNIRLSLIDDSTLITSFGIIYDTSTFVPIAKNGQVMSPALALPDRDFYVTSYNNTSGPDVLYFIDEQSSYKISSLGTSVSGTPGALAVTNDGGTLFVSSTGGMTKFSIGTTPPGTGVPLPEGLKQYRDFEFDMPRNVVYGTDASNRVDVIDQNTGNVIKSYLLPNGANPKGIDLSPTGDELAVALNGLEKILFLHPETGAKIAEVTPQLTKDIYYTNLPYDVIYGRAGRLYSDGNPSSGGIDYLHVFDTSTHIWLAKSIDSVRNEVELAITTDNQHLYANESGNVRVYDVQTDAIIRLYQGPFSVVSASKFTIVPDGSKVFTSGGQVWSGDMQEQLGTLEGGTGKLIEFIPGRNVVALVASGQNGDVIRFLSPLNFRLLSTYDPIGNGTYTEMEAAPDGSKLILNSNNAIQILSLDPTLPVSITVENGSAQSVQVSTPFQNPLKVKVQNLYGNPLRNVTVTFQAPASGASATFVNTNSNTTSAITDISGVATSAILFANNVGGSYAVQATTPNLNTSVSFQLTNLASVNCTLVYGTSSASLFEPYKQYQCGKMAEGVVSGDFNHDGRTDAAIATGDGLLLVFLQGGNGHLANQPRVYAGSNSPVLAVGDLNHDGRDDIVIPAGSEIRVFLQNNDGTFPYPVVYPTGASAGALAVGDVNHDGLADVVVNIGSNLMGVFTQKQGGGFNPMVAYPSPGSAEIAIGDVNGDGKNDVVSLSGQSTNQLQIFIQSNGILSPYVSKGLTSCSYSCWGGGIGIGDVTKDGRADVVMSYGGNRPYSYVAVFAQDANGDLQPPVTYGSYDIPEPVEIADVNSDNLSDIILLHSGWQAAGVYLQKSNGAPSAESLYTIPYKSWYSPLGLDVGDVNTDSFPDLLIADGQGLVILYRNPVIPPTPTPYVSPTPGPGPSPTPRASATPGPSPTPVPPSSTGNRRTYTAAGGGSLPGTLLCDQNQSSCTNGADLDADAAHRYAADTFVFYNTHHGRNSFDNAGSTILSTVNYGVSYRNAFWNGSQVVYGDSMAADDVVAHEITHGVTEYTSGLIYYGQSGAINESFSDVWGEFIDQINGSGTDSLSLKWLMGEDSALGAIRSMSNPPAYGDPDRMSSPYFYTGSDDNGGVHINSGVNNKAAYLMVEGGTFNGRTILGIGIDKTAAVYYAAQVNHLTMGANYNDLYYALLQACQNLIGVDGMTENDCEQVQLAAEAVEMFSDITIPTDIPTYYPDTSTPTATQFTPATPTKTKTPTPTFIFTPTRTGTPTGTATATATSHTPNVGVWIAGSQTGSHLLDQGQAMRVSYPSINSGPVKILSTNMNSLVGAESIIYKVNGVNTSFSEMMGLPDSQLDTTYWLPWYNNVDLDTQLRFANVSNTTATVRVYIGGLEMTDSPFMLLAGESTRKSFAGINNGPVRIVSNVSIVAAERIIYRVNGVNTSFSEMMALPASQLDTTYWLPWYNNVDLDTQLRFANVSNTTATVRVYIGGLEMSGSPFTLQPSESTRKSFAGVNSGPVEIVSTRPIVAAERIIYRVNGVNTSFSEMMALSASQLDTTYWLPWYNNVDLDTQLRFANTTNTPATVHVYIGGLEMSGSPFTLHPSESTRRSFAGINSGPVKVTSDVPIVAAERVIYNVNGVNTSFSETMGLPNSLLDTTYWFPWYNNIDLLTQLRFGIP